MQIDFTHYVHDGKESWRDQLEGALEDVGIGDPEEQDEIIQRTQFPFYEIGFNCTLETETGEVTFSVAKEGA